MSQEVAKGHLRKLGYEVSVASDGHEALLQLETEASFDAILMDVQMPGMDGLEATRSIRSRERETGEHVPIIGFTAHAMREDRALCQDAGMDDYLTKPVRRHELESVLKRCLPHAADVDRLTAQAHSMDTPLQRPVIFRRDRALDLAGTMACFDSWRDCFSKSRSMWKHRSPPGRVREIWRKFGGAFTRCWDGGNDGAGADPGNSRNSPG